MGLRVEGRLPEGLLKGNWVQKRGWLRAQPSLAPGAMVHNCSRIIVPVLIAGAVMSAEALMSDWLV